MDQSDGKNRSSLVDRADRLLIEREPYGVTELSNVSDHIATTKGLSSILLLPVLSVFGLLGGVTAWISKD